MASSLAEVRGSGGGGGGSSGGKGGNGGGVIAITARGSMAIGLDGLLSANGAAGVRGTGSCGSVVPPLPAVTTSGGGGGGAGGALLLRSFGSLSLHSENKDALSVKGGGSDGSDCNVGGKGGVGHLRVDSPTDPEFIGNYSRGPMWKSMPMIVREAVLSASISDTNGTTFSYNLNGGTTLVPINEPDNIEISLSPGSNEICAFVENDIFIAEEGRNCVTVAYIPE